LIQKRLQELQQLQRTLGPKNPYTGAPIRRAMPKPVIAPPGSTSLDHRPTAIYITGFSVDDADALLGHFKHYGEITKHQLDKNVPSLVVAYSMRYNAEQAIARGKQFQEKPLQVN
jgi:RNA-binding protein 26